MATAGAVPPAVAAAPPTHAASYSAVKSPPQGGKSPGRAVIFAWTFLANLASCHQAFISADDDEAKWEICKEAHVTPVSVAHVNFARGSARSGSKRDNLVAKGVQLDVEVAIGHAKDHPKLKGFRFVDIFKGGLYRL
jgi:hypothetical protein